jgi:hypothetical protein
MARVISNTVDFFPHFAKVGQTIFILKNRWGNDGYAFWFQLLELLCKQEGHSYDCRSEASWQYLMGYCSTGPETTVEILDMLAKLQNIDPDLWAERVIWCPALVENLASVYKNRRRNLPQKPQTTGNKPITTGNNGITTVIIPQRRGEERRGKERRDPPTPLTTTSPPAESSADSSSSKDEFSHPIKKEPPPEPTAVIKEFETCGGVIASQRIALELADAEREYGSRIVIAGFRRASLRGISGTRLLAYCRPIWEEFKANGGPDATDGNGSATNGNGNPQGANHGTNKKRAQTGRWVPTTYTDPAERRAQLQAASLSRQSAQT